MERLKWIAKEVNEKMAGKFPYFHCVAVENSLSDSVYIVLSLDAPTAWPCKILENSRYLKAHIFVNGQREKPTSTFSFKANSGSFKLRAKNNEPDAAKMVAHVIRQLEKLL